MNSKLRILIIANDFPPRNATGSHRPYSWAKYWSRAGHDVTVLTTKKVRSFDDLAFDMTTFRVVEVPWIPEWMQRLAGRSRPSQGEPLGTPKISVGHLFKKALAGLLLKPLSFLQRKYGLFLAQRMPDVFLYWRIRAYYRISEEQEWDVVVSTHCPYATHLLAHSLKKRGKAKAWVADYRDLWTDNHLYPGLWPCTLYEKYLERRMLPLADMATTVSPPLTATLTKRYPFVRAITIYNGHDLTGAERFNRGTSWIENNDTNDRTIRIVHTGWIYPQIRDPTPIFQALRHLHEENEGGELNVEVVFVGPYSESIANLASMLRVEQYVRQIGFRSWEETLRIQREATILLLIECRTHVNDGILSGKIYEYMSSGTQIWAVGPPDRSVSEMINRSRTGIHFGEDVDRLAAALRNLLSTRTKPTIDPDLDFVSSFSREAQANRLLEVVQQLGNDVERAGSRDC